jgi:hypothetical protein
MDWFNLQLEIPEEPVEDSTDGPEPHAGVEPGFMNLMPFSAQDNDVLLQRHKVTSKKHIELLLVYPELLIVQSKPIRVTF